MSKKEQFVAKFTQKAAQFKARRVEIARELLSCDPERALILAEQLPRIIEDEQHALLSIRVFEAADETHVEEQVRWARLVMDAEGFSLD